MVALAVTASAHRLVPAERATVGVVVHIEDDDRQRVVDAASALHHRISEEAAAHRESGAATRWSADQLHVRTEARSAGERDPEHRITVASAEISVRFADFTAMSGWLTALSELEGVDIPGLAWSVTDARRAEVEREVRAAAVRQVRERAAEYATALRATSVELVALHEPGLRGHGSEGEVRFARGTSESPIRLRPEEIEISASLDADLVLEGVDALAELPA